MNIHQQIQTYITTQPGPKSADMQLLHELIQSLMPQCRLWYLDGKDETGKVVSNPNIGYGVQTLKYSDCKTKEFYQIGLSANTSGISVYVMGLADKTYLAQTFGQELGKASVTGYCIKFKGIKDINSEVLASAIRYRVSQTGV